MLEKPIARRQIPFYGSYAGFYRAMKALKDGGVPRQIVARVLGPHLEDEASRIVTGLFSIGLIDEAGRPTHDLLKMAQTFGESSWGSTLTEFVPKAYPYLQELDLETVSNKDLRDAFVAYLGRDAESLRNAETFFLCLSAEAGFPMAEGFSRRASRGIGEAKRWIRLAELESPDEKAIKAQEPVHVVPAEPLSSNKISQLAAQIVDLTALLSEGDMTDQEKKAVALTISVLARRMNAA
jgi:hypothetical protein